MKVLITGGAGYIGSTVASACLDAGHEVVVLDDFSTGRREFVTDRVCYEGDIADASLVDRICREQAASGRPIDAVVHCAAKIIVPESVANPYVYYENNVGKTLDLVASLLRNSVHRLIFSSSASIYAPDERGMVTEDSPLAAGSPYAATKLMTERVLADIAAATGLRVLSLRYFNPIGTDPRLRTGQQIEHPTHVMGKLMDAALSHSPFTVTGVDWPTRDGSGIRDFIHVWDLAQAHVAALEHFDDVTATLPSVAINIGTGQGVTVKELVEAFQEVTGERLDVTYGPPRPGDVAGSFTISERARAMLGWTAQRSIADGVRDALAWLPRRREVLGY